MRTGIAFTLIAGCYALSSPNPVIKTMAQGMSLLKPIFAVEAQLQAAILGSSVDEEMIKSEIEELKKKNKVLIYTYGLSPFSTEAVGLLEGAGYEYTKIELGAEWFLLGPEASVTRVALSKEVASGATSLPKIFIGGKCIGGCSDLAGLVENGELEILMKQAGVPKMGEGGKKSPWPFFQ
jgi:glutaredoxin 3